MLPEGFILRMQSLLGEEYAAFSASFDRPLCTGLRLNPLKTGFTGDLSRFSLSPVPWCPTGYVYDAASRPGLSSYHAAGLYYLQEPSAMAPAELLDPQPGERVLDLCAAPGGKSTQIAALMAGQGLLVCNEPVPNRAQILSRNVERMGEHFLLTSREMDVLTLYALGHTQKKVAEELFITPATAHSHIKRIYSKCGMHSRQEILEYLNSYGS